MIFRLNFGGLYGKSPMNKSLDFFYLLFSIINSSRFDFITETFGPYITCIPFPFLITPEAPVCFKRVSLTREGSLTVVLQFHLDLLQC